MSFLRYSVACTQHREFAANCSFCRRRCRLRCRRRHRQRRFRTTQYEHTYDRSEHTDGKYDANNQQRTTPANSKQK